MRVLTKELIKELGKELSKTAFLSIAYGSVGIPKSTFFYWRKLAEEILENNPARTNLTADEELLVELLDTIEQSKAKAAKTLVDYAFKSAKTDGNIAIKLLDRLYPDEIAPQNRNGITLNQGQDVDGSSGIALIPILDGTQNIEEMLKQQQKGVQKLAQDKTKDIQNGHG